MSTRLILFLLLLKLVLAGSLSAQGTGLVLSGGGAKGLAHIGVIKALEDNNVSIDFVSGTSMGAIVGCLYSMGYTTDEMLELFRSEDFSRWQTGEVEPRYRFSYKAVDSDASLISVPLKREDDRAIAQIPAHLIPSQAMDFAFMDLTGGANAACSRNFDSLMVPFRCVAADIYKKEVVVFRRGNLANAVRASMTYPLYFEPITVNSRLLFDGGIYNNFPFDVLIEDFNPDFIIGSKVANRSKKPGKDDLMLQLENMIMQPTDFDIPDSIGVVVESEFSNVGLLDFEKVDTLFEIGYNSAMRMMPQIVKNAGSTSDSELDQKREEFRKRIPELKFSNIRINGIGPLQEEYVKNLITKQEDIFDITQLKEEYFRLISEENILNAYPEAVYNSSDGTYDLLLDIRLRGSYNLRAGGLLSFTNYNQAYIGFDYYALSDVFNRFSSNLFLGRYYSSFKLAHRIAVPQKNILLIDISLTGSLWNYYTNDRSSLFDSTSPIYILRREGAFSGSAGIPVDNNTTIKGGIAFTWFNDSYYQQRLFSEDEEPDNTQYFIGTAKIVTESNNLNKKQFATTGNSFEAGLFFNKGYEYFEGGNSDTLSIQEDRGYGHTWFALRLRNENYSSLTGRLVMGTLVDITLSNRSFSSNFTSSVINSYKFKPTDFSNLIYGSSLRSNSYTAIGVKPLYEISNSITVRAGFYLLAPLYPTRNIDGLATKGDLLEELRAIGEIGLVYHTPVGPLSGGINFFSHESRKAYYYLNFGYILFNRSGLD